MLNNFNDDRILEVLPVIEYPDIVSVDNLKMSCVRGFSQLQRQDFPKTFIIRM